jgi:hypothetical protein
MVTCSYCKKVGHHITKCNVVKCLKCRKIGHHHSSCSFTGLPLLDYSSSKSITLSKCDYCGIPGHHILHCHRQQYQKYLDAGALEDFYLFIMTWSERRLLWIKDAKSIISLLPSDIIRKIDDTILDFGPLADFKEMLLSLKHAETHGSGLTIIMKTFFKIPGNYFTHSDPQILYTCIGHITFTQKHLAVLSKHKLSYKYTTYHSNGN